MIRNDPVRPCSSASSADSSRTFRRSRGTAAAAAKNPRSAAAQLPTQRHHVRLHVDHRRSLFQQGDTVTFEGRDGRAITGVVVRINQRTATVGTGDGGSCRVPFHLLRHVVDI